VRPGDHLKVQILEVDDSRRRLSLSVKRVEGQELPTREPSDDVVIEEVPEGEMPPPPPPEGAGEAAEPPAAEAAPEAPPEESQPEEAPAEEPAAEETPA